MRKTDSQRGAVSLFSELSIHFPNATLGGASPVSAQFLGQVEGTVSLLKHGHQISGIVRIGRNPQTDPKASAIPCTIKRKQLLYGEPDPLSQCKGAILSCIW